jgi:hypothetical protein
MAVVSGAHAGRKTEEGRGHLREEEDEGEGRRGELIPSARDRRQRHASPQGSGGHGAARQVLLVQEEDDGRGGGLGRYGPRQGREGKGVGLALGPERGEVPFFQQSFSIFCFQTKVLFSFICKFKLFLKY